MPLTPETLTKHELVGLHVRVVSATNPSLEAIEGRVVSETMRTLTVESASRSWQVPKQGTTFEFELTNEAAAPCKGAGTASELPAETAGGRSGQSGGVSGSHPGTRRHSDDGEGVAYVTVDGTNLLSRPALRTETGGNSKWR
ncbi:ribonuclease P protein component 1 [Haladaptatus sp. T7]|uniref:ribonuclease P protein component 1 n=1 Tax=Haladaptatus sp. T7 TaxID=2029368 RepID=UPI0021A2511B|nr:ribonuclease P protein component 1 [Haladaptatus sp. T7]GKZ12858.1 ribonuclease P [Haladaptatus sp. T7]